MAKGIDPFETFKAATLGEASLSDAIKLGAPSKTELEKKSSANQVVAQEPEAPAAVTRKISKMANKEQICLYIDKDLKKRMGRVKFEDGISYNDFIEEAIRLNLEKYGK